jgi:hypothetical protein
MLIESRRHQAERLPQILASSAIMVWLQRSRRDEEEEQRKRNSPKFGWRQWGSGERAEEGPISQQCCREERRRRRRWCRTLASGGAGVQVGDGGGFPSLFLGPAMKRKGQRNGGG